MAKPRTPWSRWYLRSYQRSSIKRWTTFSISNITTHQLRVRSLVHNIVEQVVLDLLRKEDVRETLQGHRAYSSGTTAAPDRLLKKSSNIRLIYCADFNVRATKNNSVVTVQSTTLTKARKGKTIAATQAYGDIVKDSPGRIGK